MGRLIFIAACAVFIFVSMPALMQDWLEKNGYTAQRQETAISAQGQKSAQKGRSGRVTLKANASGHYLTQAYLNNKPIRVLIDTGATVVALRHEDAQKMGLRPRKSDYKVPVRTANGLIHAASVTLRSVRIGSIEERNIRALISPPGAQNITLMGMAFLSKLKRFEIRQGKMRLEN